MDSRAQMERFILVRNRKDYFSERGKKEVRTPEDKKKY